MPPVSEVKQPGDISFALPGHFGHQETNGSLFAIIDNFRVSRLRAELRARNLSEAELIKISFDCESSEKGLHLVIFGVLYINGIYQSYQYQSTQRRRSISVIDIRQLSLQLLVYNIRKDCQ